MLFILLQVILFIYFIDLGSETRFELLIPNMVNGQFSVPMALFFRIQ